MIKNHPNIFVLIFLFFFSASNAQIVSATETIRIDSIMNGLMLKYKITGASIGIVDAGQISYAKGYGYADRENKIAVETKTIFGIGSITKTFTALAIIKLAEQGKIDLNRSAEYYLPELKMTSLSDSGEVLKIRNLLTHTSGLPDDVKNGDFCTETLSNWSIINELNKQVLVRPADWKMNYSNIGFDLLGLVVERVSGKKYEDYIRENILQKTGMDHSDFQLQNSPDASKGYMGDSTETKEPMLRDVPAGGIYSNVLDMSRFMMMLIDNGKTGNDSVLSSSSLRDMKTNHISHLQLNNGDQFGYGLFIERMYYVEDTIIGWGYGHAGDLITQHASMFVFPQMKVGFVIFANSEKGHSFCNTSIIKLFTEYFSKVKGIKLHEDTTLVWPEGQMKNTITDYHELAGYYPTGSDLVQIKNHGKSKLIFKQGHSRLTLKKDEDGGYSVKAHFLLFLRIKVKSLRFAFEKIGNDIYLKQLNDRQKRADYMLVKKNPVPVLEEWQQMAGKYKALNSCEGNIQGIPVELEIYKNKIYLKLQYPDGQFDYYSFDQLSNILAATDGIGRGCGMTMSILPNGHLYFSGYELEKEVK